MGDAEKSAMFIPTPLQNDSTDFSVLSFCKGVGINIADFSAMFIPTPLQNDSTEKSVDS